MKTPWSRTPDELKVVFDVVDKLKGFKRYPPFVKRELAKVVYFESFENGRVVVQQGTGLFDGVGIICWKIY